MSSPKCIGWAFLILSTWYSLACTGCGESEVTTQSEPAPPARQLVFTEPLIVEITGADYQWHIRYAGLDGIHETADDVLTRRHIWLPVDTAIRFKLASRDYIYTISLPNANEKKMAIPELFFSLDYEAPATGSFPYEGDQMCGFSHPLLMGNLVVVSLDEFAAWLTDQARQSQTGDGIDGPQGLDFKQNT